MTHPLELTNPGLAAAIHKVPAENTTPVAAALAREGIRNITAYTQGPVWGTLYGVLSTAGLETAAQDVEVAHQAAREELRLHEIDGLDILARLEGRVSVAAGDLRPSRGQYESHHHTSWRLRAVLLALKASTPAQLMDIVQCLRNGGVSEADIVSKL